MISEADYENIKNRAYDDAEKILTDGGYFFSDYYSDYDMENLEKLLWSCAKKYYDNEISSSTFCVICSDYQGNPIYYNISEPARILIANGLELDYFKYINPNNYQEFEKINNDIRKLVIFYYFKN